MPAWEYTTWMRTYGVIGAEDWPRRDELEERFMAEPKAELPELRRILSELEPAFVRWREEDQLTAWNALGAEGWEVFHVQRRVDGSALHVIAHLKRIAVPGAEPHRPIGFLREDVGSVTR